MNCIRQIGNQSFRLGELINSDFVHAFGDTKLGTQLFNFSIFSG